MADKRLKSKGASNGMRKATTNKIEITQIIKKINNQKLRGCLYI